MIIDCEFLNSVNLGNEELPDYEFASSTCNATGTIEISTSSLPAIESGFTHGEIVMSLFLFLIFITVLLNLGWSLFKVKKYDN